ncbi:MAG TPA: glutamyl-tRNA reductase [Thermoanaerobaculia bacterium]|jgi:glutamyl-tRNA reductase|nr:glutamyl-tRNA reductase [Thermoanaerobaculia bacterium]
MTSSGEARLLLLGWNFRTAALSVRERVAFSSDEVREALDRIRGEGLVSEGVIVSTCNRSEIYGVSDGSHTSSHLTRLISEWRGLDVREAEAGSFYREGRDAARHLFRVAAGLESLALGESEVLGQVRTALRLAREAGATRAVLHRMFETAVSAGKRVRTETEIARHPLSVAAIGFELATKVFGDMAERTVLVLGAGETGTLFAQQAAAAGVRDVRIANRSLPRAEELAARMGGRAVPWDALPRALPEADVVVGTTASAEPVVSRADVETAMRERRGRPVFFLDLAIPRDFEAGVGDLYNVYAYGLDDLREVAEENRRRRSREVPRAEEILEEELARFLAWFGNLAVVPTLNDLQARLAALRDTELERLPPKERERFRAFADAIASKLLHEPLRRLKAEPDASRKLDRVEAVRHLFDLDS